MTFTNIVDIKHEHNDTIDVNLLAGIFHKRVQSEPSSIFKLTDLLSGIRLCNAPPGKTKVGSAFYKDAVVISRGPLKQIVCCQTGKKPWWATDRPWDPRILGPSSGGQLRGSTSVFFGSCWPFLGFFETVN